MAWQLKFSLILVPAVVYLVMALSLKYPATERVMSNLSTGDMWKQAMRPLFHRAVGVHVDDRGD